MLFVNPFRFPAAAAGPAIGAHTLKGWFEGHGVSPAVTDAITTQATGSCFVYVEAGLNADTAVPVDSKSNTLTQKGTASGYDGYGTTWTIKVYVKEDGVGGSSHTISKTKASDPTGEFVEGLIEAKGCNTLVDFKQSYAHSPDANTTDSVTTTGPAVLIAIWSGDGGVTNTVVTPGSGWTMLDAYTDWSASPGNTSIQTCVAARVVSGAGSYSCAFSETPTQGANLFIFAFQNVPAVVAPSLGVHGKASGNGVTTLTTAAVTTVAGHPLYAWTTLGSANVSSVSDNKGNTWTEIGTLVQSTHAGLRAWKCNSPVGVGAGHTFTANYTGSEFPHLEFGQILNAPGGVDINAQGVDNSDPRTLSTSGSTSNGNQLVLALICTGEGGTVPYTTPSGYTALDKEADGNTYWTGAAAYKVINTAAVQSVSWTAGGTGTADGALKLITFKGA